MNNLIKNIIDGVDLNLIIDKVMKKLYVDGPTNNETMEILTYLKYYQNEFFSNYENEILEIMGVFYKDSTPLGLKGLIMSDYRESIKEKFGKYLTPVQADIYSNIINNKYFSFSSATSTGKSFIFQEIIKEATKDVVIIVPSRALINEYFIKILEIIESKNVNILPFVDIVNKKNARRSIFILTPERAKELFKYKDSINVEFFLFDEAQLGDEENTRGIIFDGIVRRSEKAFPMAKKLFAHPFISNPEAQLIKNNLYGENSSASNYLEKNIGQMFVSYKDEKFYHFAINNDILENGKILMSHDPIERILRNNGAILIYTYKKRIYDNEILEKFKKYIDICDEIVDEEALSLISKLKKLIGASENIRLQSYSKMITLIKRGIILHHGSLPLQARIIIEEFTRKGFCKICFSTSTLVQGINMPFDAVWLDVFEASQPLDVKNLIGRAGRSSIKNKFDYGIVVIKDSNKPDFKRIMASDISIKAESILDSPLELPEDFEEYKDAIINDNFSDEYNLTKSEVKRLSKLEIENLAKRALDRLFVPDRIITGEEFSELTSDEKNEIYDIFKDIYQEYLNGRELSRGEKAVLSTAVRILIWEIQGKTFKQIVGYRYAYIRRNKEVRELLKKAKLALDENKKNEIMEEIKNMDAKYTMQCSDIPNKNLPSINLFKEKKVYQINYDLVVYDTYDYIDKIIGFKMQDIYYAVFYELYKKTNDERASKFALYLKYGTIDQVEIMLLRYGFSFETIEWLKQYVIKIDDYEILFGDISGLNETEIREISRYI